jgi:UMF1 family MFS transporter
LSVLFHNNHDFISLNQQPNAKRALFGWAFYDWANSAFATTIMAGFFPIFFKDYWSAGVDTTMTTARLGLANSVASIAVAVMAPLLGAIADRGTKRKKFLIFFAYLGVLMTCLLYTISQGNWQAAAVLYVLAFTGFAGGNIFYDSLLSSVASENKLDVVSSLGYSLGYLGGGLLFALNVWTTLNPAAFGFESQASAVQFSFLTVGVWWGMFTVPLILFVKEPVVREPTAGFAMVKAGLRQLRDTFREIRHLKTIFLFLVAYWLYIDGVDTVILMAVNYGKSIGFGTEDLIVALLITQFVGFPAAIGFGYLAQKIRPKRAILLAIGVYLFVSIWGAFMTEVREFYTLAVIIGLVQGGVQALSRSLYARLIPPDKSAQYFGFYNMLGKFAAVMGPLLVGGAGLLFHAMGYSSDAASRGSIAAISLLFLAGGIVLLFVNEEKGKEEAKTLTVTPHDE